MSEEIWEYEHSVEGKVSRSALWGLYSDVKTWPEWDKGIERIRLYGEFREGTPGTIKPVGQGQLPFRLTKVTVDGGFSDETEIPGAEVTIGFKHTLESVGRGETVVTMGITAGNDPSANLMRLFIEQVTRERHHHGRTNDLIQFVISTGIKPAIGQVLPMEKAREGFRAMVEGRTSGKTVFTR